MNLCTCKFKDKSLGMSENPRTEDGDKSNCTIIICYNLIERGREKRRSEVTLENSTFAKYY